MNTNDTNWMFHVLLWKWKNIVICEQNYTWITKIH